MSCVSEKKATGRPPKEIDWKKVDLYIKAGCTGLEIAAEFDMHHATFYEKVKEKYGIHFTALASQLSPAGELNIRVKQYLLALQGNVKLLQILGQERLGQNKVKDENSHTYTVNITDFSSMKAKEEVNQINTLGLI